MSNKRKLIVDILNNARRECREQGDCSKCAYVNNGADCLHAMMADRLIKAGITIPSHCAKCNNPNNDCDICRIKNSSALKAVKNGVCNYCTIGGCDKC
jgi:hypothetical protein